MLRIKAYDLHSESPPRIDAFYDFFFFFLNNKCKQYEFKKK